MTKLFVYGTLKKGKYNHTRFNFDKSLFLGTKSVSGFTLVQEEGVPYPFCIQENGGKVTGELYEVSPEVMTNLDHMETRAGYKRVDVTLDSGEAACIYIEGRDKTFPNLKRFSEF